MQIFSIEWRLHIIYLSYMNDNFIDYPPPLVYLNLFKQVYLFALVNVIKFLT